MTYKNVIRLSQAVLHETSLMSYISSRALHADPQCSMKHECLRMHGMR